MNIQGTICTTIIQVGVRVKIKWQVKVTVMESYVTLYAGWDNTVWYEV